VNAPVPGYLPLGLAEIVEVVTDKLIKLTLRTFLPPPRAFDISEGRPFGRGVGPFQSIIFRSGWGQMRVAFLYSLLGKVPVTCARTLGCSEDTPRKVSSSRRLQVKERPWSQTRLTGSFSEFWN
jgi:hypothetical protein